MQLIEQSKNYARSGWAWVVKNKWWLLVVAAILILVYVFWPPREKKVVDIPALEQRNAALEQSVKSQDAIIAMLNDTILDREVKTQAAEQAAAWQYEQNDELVAENAKLVARYEKAKADRDTVEIGEACDELKSANVKLAATVKQTAISTQKVVRELKGQIKVKDELIGQQRVKIDLLKGAVDTLQKENVQMAKDLNRSEKARVRNGKMAKGLALVAGVLAGILVLK